MGQARSGLTGAVTVDQLLAYLHDHRDEIPVAQLARDSGVARSVLYRMLARRGNITVGTLQAVLDALAKVTGTPCRLLIVVGDA